MMIDDDHDDVTDLSHDVMNVWTGTTSQRYSTVGFFHNKNVCACWAKCQHHVAEMKGRSSDTQ